MPADLDDPVEKNARARKCALAGLLVIALWTAACGLEVAGIGTLAVTEDGGAPASTPRGQLPPDASGADAVVGAATVVVGDERVEGFVTGVSPGLAEAFAYEARRASSLSRIAFYVDGASAASGARLGIYDDAEGRPGALLATAELVSPRPGAWNDVSTSRPVVVVSGQHLWLAVLVPAGAGDTLGFRTASLEASNQNMVLGMASLPASWGSGAATSDGPASMYAY